MTLPLPTFQVWDAEGATPLGVLTGCASPVLSTVFCGLSALKFSVPRNIPGASLILDPDIDRQLRIVLPGQDDQWFLVDEDSFEGVSDDAPTEVVDFTCRGIAGLFDEAVVYPSGGAGWLPAEWSWAAPTPGEIVTDLVADAQSRGLLAGVTVAGDATADAVGDTWAPMPDVTYRAGTTLQAVLAGLAEQQLVEWRFAGRVLELHAPGGGLDRDLALTLRPRREVSSAPTSNSRRSVATNVLVEGADSETVARSVTIPGRRRREAYLSQTSVPAGSLPQLGDYYLAAHASPDSQMTHKLADTSTAPIPGVDYRPGDRVLTPVTGTAVTRRRIQQVTVDWEAGEVTLELGSLLASTEERFARQLARLLPGDSSLT